MSFKRTFNAFKGITLRNMKVYFNDKMAIIFSLMTPAIVLLLYLLFLKNNLVNSISDLAEPLGGLVTDDMIDAIVTSWMITGVVGTAFITFALNSLTLMVTDKQKKIDFDYNASPVKSGTVMLSYLASGIICTIISSALLLTAGLVLLAVDDCLFLSTTEIIYAYGVAILGSVSASVVLMVIISFFKKPGTLSAFTGILSAAIGFIIGAYIPVSEFGESMQTAVNLVPGSQVAGLLRNIFLAPAIANADKAIGGIDNGMFAETITDEFSLKLNIFGNSCDTDFMLIYSGAAIIIFLLINFIVFKLTTKRKA